MCRRRCFVTDVLHGCSHGFSYQARALFGMDLSSIIAVEAMGVHPDDHVMDLCCAPGAKLCMLANLVASGKGTVTGVDIAPHRLATCRALLKKYNVGFNVRLFAADGTLFDAHPPARVGGDLVAPLHEKPSVMPYWAPKVLRHAQQATTLYDKVLVDAECTHDGSIAHILKYEQWGWDAFEKNFMDPSRIDTITELQVSNVKRSRRWMAHPSYTAQTAGSRLENAPTGWYRGVQHMLFDDTAKRRHHWLVPAIAYGCDVGTRPRHGSPARYTRADQVQCMRDP